MPIVFLCILIFAIKQKKVVIGDGSVLPDVLLRHKCGSNGNDVTISESNLYGSEVPYCLDSDVLGRVDGMAKGLSFKVEYRKKDYGCLFNDVFCGSFCIVFFVVFA